MLLFIIYIYIYIYIYTKDKASTVKLAKELKAKEDMEKIEAARARKVAVQIVNQIVS